MAGDVQRRRAVLLCPIDLRAFLQQQPRRVDAAVLAGGVQRRLTVLRRLINVRAFFQQPPHRCDVAFRARLPKILFSLSLLRRRGRVCDAAAIVAT